MGPIRGDTLASLRQHGVVCRQAFGCEFFGTPTPSLCHPIPRRLALWIARKLGHLLAVGGVFQKFVRWIHRAVSLGEFNTTRRSVGKFHVQVWGDCWRGSAWETHGAR